VYVVVVGAGELVVVDADVEGTDDLLCPRLLCLSGCQSDCELPGIMPSAGVDVNGLCVVEVLGGVISVKQDKHIIYRLYHSSPDNTDVS